MFTISKDFTFSASHVLQGLPATHPCSRLHGHNYTVRVELTGTLDPVGFVVDYRDLTPFKEYLDDELDHRHLNDLMGENPTAEHMARKLCIVVWDMLATMDTAALERVQHITVAVSETPKTWARHTAANPYSPDPIAADEDRYRWGVGTDG